MSNFIITTLENLEAKMDLVSNLIDIKAGLDIQKGGKKNKKSNKKEEILQTKLEPNPIDKVYENL
jgi:hypothetical protein